MSRKIYGRPIATPLNPSALIPNDVVKTVNGIAPDENGNVEVTVSGGNVDLTGYATEQYVQDYAQPKGNYLTEHQDLSGYAKTEDVPTDAHINDLINTALGVIENGTY